ncbi:hypothetical protein [Streptomyces sp. MZ04]|uniref:hypothetical protein n=1 Tax=Streptomyces sp. MZ04 TaxID=2559236 RepID=UPI00107ECB5A|nr:hypothetical protein [Streptomyces sp. MZ04]TGB00773.1 hypothetical protein E2651_28315 [Streptomyces sp. MZ04]
MTLSPATAAIIGMSLGAVASFSGAWFTQRATDRRERESRVWSRRMDVYEEAMVIVRRLGGLRVELGRTGDWPDGTGAALTDAEVLAARLEIYASVPVLKAHLATFRAMRAWIAAWEEWDNQEGGYARMAESDELWREFIRRVAESEKSDHEFLSILRKEVHGRRSPQLGS